MEITFNYAPNQITQLHGTVPMNSHLSASEESEASYLAYVDFVPDENVRIGMTAIVTTIDKIAEEK